MLCACVVVSVLCLCLLLCCSLLFDGCVALFVVVWFVCLVRSVCFVLLCFVCWCFLLCDIVCVWLCLFVVFV